MSRSRIVLAITCGVVAAAGLAAIARRTAPPSNAAPAPADTPRTLVLGAVPVNGGATSAQPRVVVIRPVMKDSAASGSGSRVREE